MIVVDTNIVGYLFLASEYSDQAEQLLAKDMPWAAPYLWRSELRNVLTNCLKKELIELEDALQIIAEAEQLMQDLEYEVVSSNVLMLSAQSGCSAYDCEFIALAMDLKVPLITCDKKLLAQFPQVAVSLDDFLSGPL